jgi:hypothetical protein
MGNCRRSSPPRQEPRLGKKFIESNPAPEEILARLAAWNLEEVALSFLESGFWI